MNETLILNTEFKKRDNENPGKTGGKILHYIAKILECGNASAVRLCPTV